MIGGLGSTNGWACPICSSGAWGFRLSLALVVANHFRSRFWHKHFMVSKISYLCFLLGEDPCGLLLLLIYVAAMYKMFLA